MYMSSLLAILEVATPLSEHAVGLRFERCTLGKTTGRLPMWGCGHVYFMYNEVNI